MLSHLMGLSETGRTAVHLARVRLLSRVNQLMSGERLAVTRLELTAGYLAPVPHVSHVFAAHVSVE